MNGVVSFCVGTGRCGTTLIRDLAALEPVVAASHERLRLSACFHMFCKWHDIAVDPEGFLLDRQRAVHADLEAHRVSFESSALLSHSIVELHERFDARFLLLIRRPDHTVASFAVRGWFRDPIAWGDPTLPPTIPEGVEPRHFFGRNLPRGAVELERWKKLTVIGKLAWFWNVRNRAILAQLAQLPRERSRILRLEDLDFDRYRDLAAFLGFTPTIAREAFDALVKSRPNTGPNPPLDARAWPADAVAEFEAEVATLAGALGYAHRVRAIVDGAPAVATRAEPELDDVLARLGAL